MVGEWHEFLVFNKIYLEKKRQKFIKDTKPRGGEN
tara:strand:- start:478 stop:582 length:105 start_codon:yes stop_codon:yes gene_type:complete